MAQSIVAGVQKRLKGGNDIIARMSDTGEFLPEVVEWLPTGIPTIDRALGGGLPVGRATEWYGAESAGKSAIAHAALASVQRQGGVGILLDFEDSLEKYKIANNGINFDDLIYARPDHAEQAFAILDEVFKQLAKTPPDGPLLVVWDSIGNTLTKAEFDADPDGPPVVASMSRSLTIGWKKISKRVSRLRAHVMFVNQVREDMGARTMYATYKTPGGRAIKHAASIRLMCSKGMKYVERGRKMGQLSTVEVKKNKMDIPDGKVTWVLHYKEGPSAGRTILKALTDLRVVKGNSAKRVTPWCEEKLSDAEWAARYREDPEFQEDALLAWETIMDGEDTAGASVTGDDDSQDDADD